MLTVATPAAEREEPRVDVDIRGRHGDLIVEQAGLVDLGYRTAHGPGPQMCAKNQLIEVSRRRAWFGVRPVAVVHVAIELNNRWVPAAATSRVNSQRDK